jgi:hypothetical protein
VDDFDKCVIRNAIQDFCVQEKKSFNHPETVKEKYIFLGADTFEWRSKYHVKMKQYQEEGRPILYVNESWVDSNLMLRNCWQGNHGYQANVNSGSRLIMLHVACRNGFVPNTELVYKAGSATGDYCGQMSSADFETWVVEKLVPNLSLHAVIVLDSAHCHCIKVNKPHSADALKSNMT